MEVYVLSVDSDYPASFRQEAIPYLINQRNQNILQLVIPIRLRSILTQPEDFRRVSDGRNRFFDAISLRRMDISQVFVNLSEKALAKFDDLTGEIHVLLGPFVLSDFIEMVHEGKPVPITDVISLGEAQEKYR